MGHTNYWSSREPGILGTKTGLVACKANTSLRQSLPHLSGPAHLLTVVSLDLIDTSWQSPQALPLTEDLGKCHKQLLGRGGGEISVWRVYDLWCGLEQVAYPAWAYVRLLCSS